MLSWEPLKGYGYETVEWLHGSCAQKHAQEQGHNCPHRQDFLKVWIFQFFYAVSHWITIYNYAQWWNPVGLLYYFHVFRPISLRSWSWAVWRKPWPMSAHPWRHGRWPQLHHGSWWNMAKAPGGWGFGDKQLAGASKRRQDAPRVMWGGDFCSMDFETFTS